MTIKKCKKCGMLNDNAIRVPNSEYGLSSSCLIYGCGCANPELKND